MTNELGMLDEIMKHWIFSNIDSKLISQSVGIGFF